MSTVDRAYETPAPVFKNRREALISITDAGFIVSRAKFYKDCSKPGKEGGLINVNADGSVDEEAIREYCKNLKQVKGDIKDLSNIQLLKGQKEVEKLEEQIEKLRRERRIDERKYVLKSEVDKRIVSMLLVLDVSFRKLIDMHMTDICRVLAGDSKKLNDAKDLVDELLNKMLDKLSRTDSFTIEGEK